MTTNTRNADTFHYTIDCKEWMSGHVDYMTSRYEHPSMYTMRFDGTDVVYEWNKDFTERYCVCYRVSHYNPMNYYYVDYWRNMWISVVTGVIDDKDDNDCFWNYIRCYGYGRCWKQSWWPLIK